MLLSGIRGMEWWKRKTPWNGIINGILNTSTSDGGGSQFELTDKKMFLW